MIFIFYEKGCEGYEGFNLIMWFINRQTLIFRASTGEKR